MPSLSRSFGMLAFATAAALAALAIARPDAGTQRVDARLEVEAVVAPDTAAVPGVGLVDLGLSASPPSSVDVLRERLAALGASGDAVEAAIPQLVGAREMSAGELPDVEAVIERLALPAAEAARAVGLARAFVERRPVALDGLSLEPQHAALVDRLVSDGVDPDAAAWLVRQAREVEEHAETGDRERLLELARGVALASGVATEVVEAAVEPRLVSGGSDSARRPEAATVALGGGLAELPSDRPVALLATCKTCPQFDFPFTPTTNYQTHASTIDAGGCRIYRFTVAAAHQYRFTFCEGGGTATFDSVFDAFGTSCNALASNDDTCLTRSQLDVTTAAAGYVYLRITAKLGVAGSYTLAFKDLGLAPSGCVTCPTFDHGTFTPTTSYQTHSSSIGPGGCRLYRFSLQLGHSYRFTFCEGGGSTTFASALQTLTGSCGLGPANAGACGMGSQVDVGVQSTGYYFVKVTSPSGGSGSFTLAYRDITADCPACPIFNYGRFRPKTTPQTHSAMVVNNGCRIYAFELGAGIPYHFSLCQNGGTASFPAQLTLYSGCMQVASNATGCVGLPQVDYTPMTTGTYYLRVGPQSGGGGTYTLAYWSDCRWCDEFNHGPVTPDCTVPCDAGNLSPGCTEVWAFDVIGGSRYRFSTCQPCSSAIDTKLTALGPSCAVLVSSSNGCLSTAAEVTATAPGTGPTRIHLVVQAETSGVSGSYALSYTLDPASDRDMDGTFDCSDGCPDDANKTAPGQCGCGVPETGDSDMDGTLDCADGCPNDTNKTAPGQCGCGLLDTDTDMDGTADCNDGCPADIGKTAPGTCGCGVPDTDSDMDGTADCNDGCPNDMNKTAPGTCGCGVPDTDSDMDGTADCNDGCPNDIGKTAPGTCGCGVPDTDSDMDGTADCNDGCPNDPLKTEPLLCGCGKVDTGGIEEKKVTETPVPVKNDNFGNPALDGDTAAFGQPVKTGAVFVWFRSAGTWALQQKVTSPAPNATARFGNAIGLSTNTMAVSAPGDMAVYVFVRSGAVWSLQQTISKPADASNAFAANGIALDGDTLVVGDRTRLNMGVAVGGAYVFKRTGVTWTQQAVLVASDGVLNDSFGASVSVSGNTALISADMRDDKGSDSGAAYVFVRNPMTSTWSQQAKLLASDGIAADNFGVALDLSGDTAAIGAILVDLPGKLNVGAVYVFVRDTMTSTWSQQAKLTALDGAAQDRLGLGVAIAGSTIAAGAQRASGIGAAYVFTRRSNGAWLQAKKLTPSDGAANDRFGLIDVSGQRVAVGAPDADDSLVTTDSGKAYIYDLCP